MTSPVLPRAMVLRIMLPFAAGYFLSYLYRTVNAVISPDLVSALGLDAADLGLLTSVYFLTFGLFQLPLGLLLDRFGPRRVETVLLLIAAAGATVFALADSLATLVVGRALIGLGVSACLMGSFKATASWFPAERVPAMNAWIMSAGGLGALAATTPVQEALTITDWRGVIIALALLSTLVAAALLLVSPERPQRPVGGFKSLLAGVLQIYRSAYFWRIVPLCVLSQAAFLSIQGLWAGPWLKDVAGLERAAVANHLFMIAAAMVAGFLLLGQIASRLAQRGVSLETSSAVAIGVFLLAQLALIVTTTDFALPLWLAFAFFGSSGILFFPLLSQHFPPEFTGRVHTAANVLVFLSAFVAQWAIGAVVNLWPQAEGYAPQGYTVAFGAFLLLQVLGYLWYLRPLVSYKPRTDK